mmetsp:Transcript_18040/g.42823  ORF Transcript_18040/g.42823 Transcript_18040/m.42823 type:complete len:257 (-) Transcript_18040:29-799(-)
MRCCGDCISALRQRSQKRGSAACGRWCFLQSTWLHASRSCDEGMPVGLCRLASAGSSCTVYSLSVAWPRMLARLHSALGVSCTSMSEPFSYLFRSSSAGRSLACFIVEPRSSSSSGKAPPLLAAWWLSRRCRFCPAVWPPTGPSPSVEARFLSFAGLRAAGCIESATFFQSAAPLSVILTFAYRTTTSCASRFGPPAPSHPRRLMPRRCCPPGPICGRCCCKCACWRCGWYAPPPPMPPPPPYPPPGGPPYPPPPP